MRAVDVIVRKRDGLELDRSEIEFFVHGFARGEIPDYQASAWAMAVLLQGMTRQETVDLTMSMASSGDTLDLHDVAPIVVDKHSTGGVGDKTTIAVAPMVAACGLPVGKMSGRGLGFSGGTLDKLESIPGYRVDLTIDEFRAQLERTGLVVSGQTKELAPADGKLYALRDVTGTVPSLPLIASSIMSKKIAAGADAIVLDVKAGRGAFMKTVEEAQALATAMVDIGKGVDRQVSAVISDMSQPLGCAVGNAIEVAEAIDVLHGKGPADLLEHCLAVAEQMLLLGGQAADTIAARQMLEDVIDSGRAFDKLLEWISAQGGDVSVCHDPSLMPVGPVIREVNAPWSGTIASIDAMEVGLTAVDLGAGRAQKGDPVDHRVGIKLAAKIGNHVKVGDRVCTVYARDETDAQAAAQRMLAAYTCTEETVGPPPLIYGVIR